MEAFGLDAFNHPWMFQVSYVFPPSTLVPLVLSNLLVEHVKGQPRLLILEAPCWVEVLWLPTVLNISAEVPDHSLIVKDLIMDILVGHMLRV